MTDSNVVEELYASFARIYGDGKPLVGVFELSAANRLYQRLLTGG